MMLILINIFALKMQYQFKNFSQQALIKQKNLKERNVSVCHFLSHEVRLKINFIQSLNTLLAAQLIHDVLDDNRRSRAELQQTMADQTIPTGKKEKNCLVETEHSNDFSPSKQQLNAPVSSSYSLRSSQIQPVHLSPR